MKNQILKTGLIVILIAFVGMLNFSCSLNPLNGFLNSLNVKIISTGTLNKPASPPSVPHVHSSSVPTSTPTKAGDFDCIAFSVTGYGIDEKTNAPGSEVPIEQFRFGHETPMQATTGNSSLSFNVEIPSLLGVSSELQSRVIQVYGVYTSNADKTFCVGKTLSEFLVGEDPYATVYLIGTNTYPSTTATNSAACTGSDLCIEDSIKKNGAGTELMYNYLFIQRDPIVPVFYYTPPAQSDIPGLFNDSDYVDPAFIRPVFETTTSKPMSTANVARVDFYFPFSKYLKDRVATGRFLFETLRAEEYPNNSGSCSGTGSGTYSTVQLKLWNGLNLTWVDPPGSSPATVASANESHFYTDYLQLSDSSVQQVTIDGNLYLVLSIRSQNTSCSSVSVQSPSIVFY